MLLFPISLTPLQQFQILTITCLAFYTIWVIYKAVISKLKAPPKDFRLEITGFANGGVRIGLFTDKRLSESGISEILMSALPVIGRKDPDILKLLFYHSLEALEGDEDIQKALTHFYEEVGETISTVPQGASQFKYSEDAPRQPT